MSVLFEMVTETVSRVPFCSEKRVLLPMPVKEPVVFTPEWDKWMNMYWWMVDYSVEPKNKAEATGLSFELDKLLKSDPQNCRITAIIEELRLLRVRESGELSDMEQWDRTALWLPDDIGGGANNRAFITDLLSGECQGVVLEAMCGFHSYLLPSDSREVVALDYSTEALKRYPFPERKRIRCDLNQVFSGAEIPCFTPEQFDAVTFCFGFRCLAYPPYLFMELLRILRPGGMVVFIENPKSGYLDLCKREFCPRTCKALLEEVGFTSYSISVFNEDYYHITAHKPRL